MMMMHKTELTMTSSTSTPTVLHGDYFLGTYGGGINKPFRYTEVQKHMFRLKDKSSTADRIVPAQPLAYYKKLGKLTRYNLRKFSELPFQLIRCYMFKVSDNQ